MTTYNTYVSNLGIWSANTCLQSTSPCLVTSQAGLRSSSSSFHHCCHFPPFLYVINFIYNYENIKILIFTHSSTRLPNGWPQPQMQPPPLVVFQHFIRNKNPTAVTHFIHNNPWFINITNVCNAMRHFDIAAPASNPTFITPSPRHTPKRGLGQLTPLSIESVNGWPLPLCGRGGH